MNVQADFLVQAGWSAAEAAPIASDASDRQYVRLHRPDGATAVLMRAPVATSRTARRQFDAFRDVGAWLRGLGLGAPEELSVDPENGLMLLEDLGDMPLSRLLEEGHRDAHRAYADAVAVLAEVAQAPPPEGLACPDATEMAAMTGMTFEQLPGSKALGEALQAALARHLVRIEGDGAVSLRDVHGDNLMWRRERAGLERIGLLDFQDALILPDGYDIASLLDDPRRTVPEPWRRDLIAAYAGRRGKSLQEMNHHVDLLSLQRNLRVLGIFRLLATEKGRPSYARFQPRTRALLWRAAAHPDLPDLQPLVADLLDRTEHWQGEHAA
jgi:hypothetical protein